MKKKVLIKYREMKILVDMDCDMSLFTKSIDRIYAFHESASTFAKNILNQSEPDAEKLTEMKSDLSEFIEKSGVIGFPFDMNDAELYAIDRGIHVDVLELHGNVGKTNAQKPDDEKLDSQITIRCRKSDKSRWVNRANSENKKLSNWVIYTLNKEA